MGVPAVIARLAPVGRKLGNGYRTQIAMSGAPAVAFWEKTVTPPGMDGGDKINTTTMLNDTVRTYSPSALVEMTDMDFTAGYDPVFIDQLMDQINVEQTFTVHFPNGDTVSFFGYLKTFKPQTLSVDEFPEAQATIVATNTDPSDGSEAVPNYVTAAGTD